MFVRTYVNSNQNNIFIVKMRLKNVVCQMAIILFRPSLLTDQMFQYTDTSWNLL